MHNNPLPRLDEDSEVRQRLLKHCRLKAGDIWIDPVSGHRVGCIDATDSHAVASLMDGCQATLAIHDPPYNLIAFETRSVEEYIAWCRKWVLTSLRHLTEDCSLYVWLGADQKNHYQPLPDFMIMMRDFPIHARSFITVRNQRGYGTQRNWMAVRQELLYYVRGKPMFNIGAEYTDIPKALKGYYKEVGGKVTENLQRGKSDTIRAGNVWLDIQQVFYRLQENVSGCYAQKPLKSIRRIIDASSRKSDIIVDFFAHSGTTLLAAEMAERRCFTTDIDPVFCEIAIRRLEHFRANGQTGWQNGHAFEQDKIALAAAENSVEQTIFPIQAMLI
ncbi:MAG: site-specific DNA-methyltransferase [Candidatus Accumulibacter sp.]|jgi:site-specific DNA-methyltransferase (adenine-specific)|nr:site-specific DNA-methyltransferase [Accumulibacter sp.]